MCRVGKLVSVTGYGQLTVKKFSDIHLADGMPAAFDIVRSPIAVQDDSPQGAIVSMIKNGTTLHLETKGFEGTNQYCFFGFTYITV